MKTCVGMEAYIQIFLFSVLEVSSQRQFKRCREERKSLTFTENVNSNPRLPRPKPIHYTDHRPYRLSNLCFILGVLRVNIPVPLTKKNIRGFDLPLSPNTFIPSGIQVFA